MKNFPEKLYGCFFFFLLLHGVVHGQITFQKTFGGSRHDFGLSVEQTSDGGYILFGETESFGQGAWDFYLVKTDQHGQKLWDKTFGRENYDLGLSVQQTRDGGYILCGAFSGFGNDSVALIKTDAQGSELWTKLYRGSVIRDVGRFVQQTADDGFIIAGFNGGHPEENVLLIKTDSDGNEEWIKTYERIGAQFGNGVKQTSDGGYIIVGQTNHRTLTGSDVYLLRIDPAGDTLWTKTYGTTDAQSGRSICIAPDGGFVILGDNQSNVQDLLMIKTDDSGHEEWSKNFGGDGQDIGYCIQPTSDGGYILSGTKYDIDNHSADMYAVKTNSEGEMEWDNVYPKNQISDGVSVQQTTDHGFVILGTTTRIIGNDSESDLYLVKTDSLGVTSSAPNPGPGILISAFPNPFTEFTLIQFENSAHVAYTLVLFDTQSRLIRKIENVTDSEIRIDKENLVPGMYIFQLEKDKKIVATGKLIFD